MKQSKSQVTAGILAVVLTLLLIFAITGWIKSYDAIYEQSCRADCSDLRYYTSYINQSYCYCSNSQYENYPEIIFISGDNNIYDAYTGEWLNNNSKPIEERYFISIKELKGGNE